MAEGTGDAVRGHTQREASPPGELQNYSIFLSWLEGYATKGWSEQEAMEELNSAKERLEQVIELRKSQLASNTRKARALQKGLPSLYR